MNIQYGLLFTKLTTDERKCGANDCLRMIEHDAACVVDVSTNAVFCEECGKCERYARKKTDEREKAGITEVPLIKGLDY